MAEGGFDERDPIMEHTDDRDDDGDSTTPFQPGSASTPGLGEQMPMTTTTVNRPPERGTAETSFIEGGYSQSSVRALEAKAWDALTGLFPNASAIDLEADYSKTGKLQVRKKGFGKKAYTLYTKEKTTGEERLNPNLTKEIRGALGQERSELIQQKNTEVGEIEKSIQEDWEVANDENEEPSVRDRAREKIQEKGEQRNALVNEIEDLERGMPLKERVKEIFKKYGVTVTAVLLAAGAVIGAVVGAITNSLKATGKALGNGLKEIAKKLGSILPGLIGTIASFIFKAAGQAISFLAEHT